MQWFDLPNGGVLEIDSVDIELRAWVLDLDDDVDVVRWLWLESQEGRVILAPEVGEA